VRFAGYYPLAQLLFHLQYPLKSNFNILEIMVPYVTSETIGNKSKLWLKKISVFNQHNMQINKDKSALLVIDMQKFFLDPASPSYTCGGLAILPGLKQFIKTFRQAGRPVIYSCHVHHPDHLDSGIMSWWWEGMCKEGTPESNVHDSIAPMPGEKVVFKHRYSAFYNTDLETILRCLKIEDVVITGVMTNMCCESTARDAYFRDYRIFFPADGTGSINEEMHVASLLNLGFGFAYITTMNQIADQLNR
jgi:nicotinamidase-related amidase